MPEENELGLLNIIVTPNNKEGISEMTELNKKSGKPIMSIFIHLALFIGLLLTFVVILKLAWTLRNNNRIIIMWRGRNPDSHWTGGTILAKMDESVNPCEDFYKVRLFLLSILWNSRKRRLFYMKIIQITPCKKCDMDFLASFSHWYSRLWDRIRWKSQHFLSKCHGNFMTWPCPKSVSCFCVENK